MRLIDADKLKEELSYKSPAPDFGIDGVILGVIDEQPAASPWHRVEEPPEEHMWCFVYTDEPKMIMPIRIAFYVASCTGKGSWYHYESGEDIDDEVDYWTPMDLEGPDVDWPIEPPKEDA